jgi:cytochrome b involved in lipid metabolism
MGRTLIAVMAAAFALSSLSPASAHQPVALLPTDTTAEQGPLLVDGTVSFAIRASFTKSGQKQAFRAALKEGDQLEVQYLIVDKKPESALSAKRLPQLVITSPTGKKLIMKFTERTKFYEPYGRTNYLYLSRYSAPAETGIYSFVATSRTKAAITIAVGDREVEGDVLRGPAPKPTPSPTATTAASTPAPAPAKTQEALYTMAKVKENNSATSCWSAINGNVYNLTKWIESHPGKPQPILGLCGTDGTSSFNARHRGQSNPTSTLAGYLLGPLEK